VANIILMCHASTTESALTPFAHFNKSACAGPG
jgi:hypothetical protein